MREEDIWATYPQGCSRLIDHTGDVGIQVTSPTLAGLFEVAALALTDLITSVDRLHHQVERHFQLQEDEIDTLLVSWLQELLYLLDTEGLIFGQFQVRLEDYKLYATAWGEMFDRKVHCAKTEIKAVTYHQLEVVRKDQVWQARVIFDI